MTAAVAEATLNFYPRPPRGGRRTAMKNVLVDMLFLSTPSARRATPVCGDQKLGQDISIHALREEGDERTAVAIGHAVIFLSTPSARRATEVLPGDTARVQLFLSTPSARRATSATFSLTTIRLPFLSTPSARRATVTQGPEWPEDYEFLSTPSARRATPTKSVSRFAIHDFYPRPPRGGRL